MPVHVNEDHTSGSSANFSQQSPRVCVCASGSQHTSRPHQVHVLHGSRENGPDRGAVIVAAVCLAQTPPPA